VGGITGELLDRAGIAVVGAGGGTGRRWIASLAGADLAVAADRVAVGIGRCGTAVGATTVVVETGRDWLVFAGSSTSGGQP
jgi:hypothetical protein